MKTKNKKINAEKKWVDEQIGASESLFNKFENAIPARMHSVAVVFAAAKVLYRAVAQAATSKLAAKFIMDDMCDYLRVNLENEYEYLKNLSNEEKNNSL